jgi:hypothetical protein
MSTMSLYDINETERLMEICRLSEHLDNLPEGVFTKEEYEVIIVFKTFVERMEKDTIMRFVNKCQSRRN